MKKITQQLHSFTLATALVFSVFAGLTSQTPIAHAQCTAGSSNGNLFGYATMSNIDGSANDNRIYMSADSWDAEESVTTNQNFSVFYDTADDTWSGRGWSSEIGWVDFGPSRQAVFEEIQADTGTWGNWNPIIDLSNVTYNNDPGGFNGLGTNAGTDAFYTGVVNPILDGHVGAGFIDFSNVSLVDSPCNEFVDMTINNNESYHQPLCPVDDPIIRWSTTNIVPGSCVATSGIWQPGVIGQTLSDNNTGTSITGTDVTTADTSFFIRMECEGVDSGNTILGQAAVSCGDRDPGDPVDPGDPGVGGTVIPEFREV